MRQTILLLFLNLALGFISYGQIKADATNSKKLNSLIKTDTAKTVYSFSCRRVETEPVFGNGTEDWMTYLCKNLNNDVPKYYGCPPGIYTVRINYAIGRDGCVLFTKAVTEIGYGMENEVIRVIEESPKWKPATQNGRIVNAFRYQYINFEVGENLYSFKW